MLKKMYPPQKQNRSAHLVLIAGFLLILGGIFVWGIYQNFGQLLARSTPLPVDLNSSNQANYSTDPDYFQIQPMSIDLIVDAIWDLNPNAGNLAVQLTQVNEIYYAVVPSITPMQIALNPDQTMLPEPSVIFSTPEPAENGEVIPDITGTSPAVSSATPGGLPLPTSTAVVLKPTNTPSKMVQVPTNTLSPSTNTVSPCSQLSLSGFTTASKRVSWTITNGSGTAITVSRINLNWPENNGSIDKIFLGTSKIWDGTAPPPSVVINSGWVGSRTIGPFSPSQIIFAFGDQSAGSGYSLTINFSNGCSLNKSN